MAVQGSRWPDDQIADVVIINPATKMPVARRELSAQINANVIVKDQGWPSARRFHHLTRIGCRISDAAALSGIPGSEIMASRISRGLSRWICRCLAASQWHRARRINTAGHQLLQHERIRP